MGYYDRFILPFASITNRKIRTTSSIYVSKRNSTIERRSIGTSITILSVKDTFNIPNVRYHGFYVYPGENGIVRIWRNIFLQIMLCIEDRIAYMVFIAACLLFLALLFLLLTHFFFLSLAFLFGSFICFASFAFTFGLAAVVAFSRNKTVFFLVLLVCFSNSAFTFGLPTVVAFFEADEMIWVGVLFRFAQFLLTFGSSVIVYRLLSTFILFSFILYRILFGLLFVPSCASG